jgi:hypothetical protein
MITEKDYNRVRYGVVGKVDGDTVDYTYRDQADAPHNMEGELSTIDARMRVTYPNIISKGDLLRIEFNSTSERIYDHNTNRLIERIPLQDRIH